MSPNPRWATTLAAIAADLRKRGMDAEHAWECAAAQLRGDPPPHEAPKPDTEPRGVAALARANDVRPATAWARIRAGWSVEDAVREPPQPRREGSGRGRWRNR